MNPVLYHHPLACSTACRIAAAEGGVALDVVRVDVFAKTLADGGDYHAVNPMGQVSALRLADGSLLTENVAILAWIQSASPSAEFRRAPETPDYYALLRWLGFIAAELHKAVLWPQFNRDVPDAMKAFAREIAPKRLAHLDRHLADRATLLGAHVSAADAYLVWFLTLARFAKFDLAPYAALEAYGERMRARPETARVLAEDGEAARTAA